LVYFRPFAKHRIIKALTEEIQEIIVPQLISSSCPKHELTIVKI